MVRQADRHEAASLLGATAQETRGFFMNVSSHCPLIHPANEGRKIERKRDEYREP